MEGKIFISYRRVDKDVVFPIVNEIEKHTGIKCWVDLSGIESGDYFENTIINAINNCEILLFMLSRESIKVPKRGKSWTQKEVDYALNRGKRVVPISIDGTLIDDCDWLAFNCSGIDGCLYNDRTQREKMFRSLSKLNPSFREISTNSDYNHRSHTEDVNNKRIIQLSIKKPVIHNQNSCNRMNVNSFFSSILKRLSDFCYKRENIILGCSFCLIFLVVMMYVVTWYDDIETENTNLYCPDRFQKNEEGMLVLTNKFTNVTPHTYKSAKQFLYDVAPVEDENGKWGLIDTLGNYLIQPSDYEGIGYVQYLNNRIPVKKDGKWGYINRDNEIVIPCQYDYANTFFSNYADVKKGNLCGLIDSLGTQIIPFKYEELIALSPWIRAKLNGKYGFIDMNDNIKVPFKYEYVGRWSCSEETCTFVVMKNDKWGVMEATNGSVETKIPLLYDDFKGYFSGGIIIAKKGDKYGCVNKKGKEITSFIYDDVEEAKFLYINGRGKYVLKVRIEDDVFYIDNKGNRVNALVSTKNQ